MEHLRWLGINSKEQRINLHSVDAMSILPFLRIRDFSVYFHELNQVLLS